MLLASPLLLLPSLMLMVSMLLLAFLHAVASFTNFASTPTVLAALFLLSFLLLRVVKASSLL
jgi:hypothetical protein